MGEVVDLPTIDRQTDTHTHILIYIEMFLRCACVHGTWLQKPRGGHHGGALISKTVVRLPRFRVQGLALNPNLLPRRSSTTAAAAAAARGAAPKIAAAERE